MNEHQKDKKDIKQSANFRAIPDNKQEEKRTKKARGQKNCTLKI